MLILTRRVGETVMIGDEITVTVLGVKGNQVRVGVNAPKSVAVHRQEIFERIQREKDEAPALPADAPPDAVGIVTDPVEVTRGGSANTPADDARRFAPGPSYYVDAQGRRLGLVVPAAAPSRGSQS